MENNSNLPENSLNDKISRKEAIQKAGKYAAFTAASMMLLMSPVSTSAKTLSGGGGQSTTKKPKKHQ